MKNIEITIEGDSPLLMNNIEGADLSAKSRKALVNYDTDEEAKKSAYWMPDKKGLCVPARCVYGCLLASASYFKVRGRSVAPILAGSIKIMPEFIPLGTDKYETDIRSVVIQKARVMKARARLDKWKLTFTIAYNEDYVDPKVLKDIITEAGVKVGLLDFRPSKRGWFGTFKVTQFKEV